MRPYLIEGDFYVAESLIFAQIRMDHCTTDAIDLLTNQKDVFNNVTCYEAGIDETDFVLPLDSEAVKNGTSMIVAWSDVEDESARWIWYNPPGKAAVISNCDELIAAVESKLTARHPQTQYPVSSVLHDVLPYNLLV